MRLLRNISTIANSKHSLTALRYIAPAGIFILIVLLVHREIYSFVMSDANYSADVGRLHSAAVPKWADTSDYRVITMDILNTLDDKFVEDVYNKLGEDAWIRKIISVERRYPNYAVAKVELRQPFVAVKMGKSYFFVDIDGVRLPGRYTAIPKEYKGMQVAVGVNGAIPTAGKKWLADEVSAAVELAGVIYKNKSTFSNIDVSAIDVSNINGRIDRRRSEIVLKTANGADIYWGRAPSTKMFGEISVEEKLKNLNMLTRVYPKLAGVKYSKLYLKGGPAVAESGVGMAGR